MSVESDRTSTKLSLDSKLIDEAKSLSLDLSQAAETGISLAVESEKKRRWKEENRTALEGWNDYIERHGLPLAEFRQF